MAQLTRNLGVDVGVGLHPRENLFTNAPAMVLLNSVTEELYCDGCASFALDVRGTYTSGVLTVEGTIDGVNWVAVPMRPYNQASTLYVITPAAAAQGIWVGRVGPFRKLRARMTVAVTVGSANVTLVVSNGLLDDTLQDNITPVLQTITAAAGALTTLTIASPGAGLRHYLTYIRIMRYASALLTPAAAPVLVTTTNIPGTLVFSMPADAAAQGTVFDYQEDFAKPIVTSAQAAATTIVAPATTGVIWRITVGYYVAP